MKDVIERIIQKEFVMLRKVNRRGGRRVSQDHFARFRDMRSGQLLVWPDRILNSYLSDLKQAEAIDRNLMFEKYAWMMKYAMPEEFKKVRHLLPEFGVERMLRMEETVGIQVVWAEEFAQMYPGIGTRGRLLHSAEDTPTQTSVESYVRSEIATYSDRTEKFYHDFVVACRRSGRNLTTEVRANQARFLGWTSLEEVEQRYQQGEKPKNFLEVLK